MKQRVATVLIAVGAWFAAWGMRILARAVVAEPVAPSPAPEAPDWAKAVHAWLETHDVEEEPDWPRQEAIKALGNPCGLYDASVGKVPVVEGSWPVKRLGPVGEPCTCQRCTVRRAQQMRGWN